MGDEGDKEEEKGGTGRRRRKKREEKEGRAQGGGRKRAWMWDSQVRACRWVGIAFTKNLEQWWGGGHSQRPPQPEPIKFLTSPVPSLTTDYNDSDHRSRGPTGHRLILKVVHKILQKPHYNPKRQQTQVKRKHEAQGSLMPALPRPHHPQMSKGSAPRFWVQAPGLGEARHLLAV